MKSALQWHPSRQVRDRQRIWASLLAAGLRIVLARLDGVQRVLDRVELLVRSTADRTDRPPRRASAHPPS